MLPHGHESDSAEPLYTLEQVKGLAGCSRTTIWRRMSRNEFPKPLARRPLLWRRSAIDNWLSGGIAAGQAANPPTGHAAAVHAHPSILRALEAGRFSGWFADLWTNNGFADAYGCDRRWLEGFGQRFEAAMRGDPETREDRLLDLQRWLVRECRRGTHKRAAEFMLQWTAYHHLDAVRARCGPSWEAKLARAFGAAVALIRRARQDACKAGIAPDRLDVVDLQAVAEIVARQVLRGESISPTDVLTSIKIHTSVVPLGEWVGEAPTRH